MTSLGEWLESLGLAQYAEAFREHAIGWDVLSQLDHNLLKDIGLARSRSAPYPACRRGTLAA